MAKRRYYLAYGSNLNMSQMALRCPGAIPVGRAVLRDYRLLFKGSGTGAYLTVEPALEREVPLIVWSVTRADEKSLDRYEGFPGFYYKKDFQLEVEPFTGGKAKMLDTFIYIMHEERKLGIPDVNYYLTCEEGYDRFGLDIGYLEQALLDSGYLGNAARFADGNWYYRDFRLAR